MPKKQQFLKVEWFLYPEGGFITLPKDDKSGYETLNDKTVKQGWNLVGQKEMKMLFEKCKEIFYHENLVFIGTEESSIKVVSSGENKGDILVPAIVSMDEVLVYHDKYPISAGMLPIRSNIAILAVR